MKLKFEVIIGMDDYDETDAQLKKVWEPLVREMLDSGSTWSEVKLVEVDRTEDEDEDY